MRSYKEFEIKGGLNGKVTEETESSRHNRSLWMTVRTVGVIAVFALLIYFGALDLTKMRMMVLRWWTGVAAICFLTSVIISVFRWQILLCAVNIRLRISVVMRLSFIGYAFSTIIPGAVSGDMVKAYYLVKGSSDKKTEAVMTILLDRVVALFTMLLTGAAAIGAVLVLMPENAQNPHQMNILRTLGYILTGSAIFVLFGFMFCLNKWIRQTRLSIWITTQAPAHRIIEKMYSTIYSFRNMKGQLGKTTVVSFIGQLPLVIGMYCIARAGDETVLRFAYYFFLSPLSAILNTIPLGPGGLGSGEALVEALFMLFGSRNGAEITAVGHLIFIFFSIIGFTLYIRGKGEYADTTIMTES